MFTCIRLFFFLLSEAGKEGVLPHHDEGVGDTGVEDILSTLYLYIFIWVLSETITN